MTESKKFFIHNMPKAKNLWNMLGSNFENVSQAFCEFLDNILSNYRGHRDDPKLVRIARIVVQHLGNCVSVMIEDGGTGIKNLDNAMTLAGLDSQESPVNEHGMGIKNALAYMDENNCDWEIATRDMVDLERNQYRISISDVIASRKH